MQYFNLQISDYELAKKTAAKITTGSRFMFTKDMQLLGSKSPNTQARRLQLGGASPQTVAGVKAIIPGRKISLPGLKVSGNSQDQNYFCSVTADRDLYKAEQDSINLLAVCPAMVHSNSQNVVLRITFAGEEYCSIDITDTLIGNNGIALETLSMLLAGQYTAQLFIDDTEAGESSTFTVAEYQLAPLSARLLSHTLDPASDSLKFELTVESYDLPWDSSIEITLVEDQHELRQITLAPQSSGKFSGEMVLSGNGPYTLRLMASNDSSRTCEVALPGSAQAHRELTVISELGDTVNFSMLPLPQSIPVRGGYVQHAEKNDVAIEINQCVSDKPALLIKEPVESMSVLSFDILQNKWHERNFVNLSAGDEVAIPQTSHMMMMFVGAWINNKPFEGFSTILSQTGPELEIHTEQTVSPGDIMTLDIRISNSNKPLPVYINIRDTRLTSSRTPQTALGSCLKDAIKLMTEPYSFYSLDPLSEHEQLRYREHPRLVKCCSASGPLRQDIDLGDVMYNEMAAPFAPEAADATPLMAQKPNPSEARSELPDSLFCGLVYVNKRETLELKLGQSLGRFNIDAFVYDNGNWHSTTDSFVVDKPARAEFDMPPVAHAGDTVYGRIRAHTLSTKAIVELRHNNNIVAFKNSGQVITTPFEMELKVKPGIYQLAVTDVETGDTDQASFEVTAPGKAKSYNHALRVLQAGDSINLDTLPGTLALDLLPGFDQAADTLTRTTADYSHLCCEQTAAKMLAASAMYITSNDALTRQEAEKIILSGVAREERMITDKGFIMYPDDDYHSEYYSKLAVQYLWQLSALQTYNGLSNSLERALAKAISFADRAAKYHKLSREIKDPKTMAEAWLLAEKDPQHKAIGVLINELLNFNGNSPSLKHPADPVFARTTMAYAAACLILQGEMKNAMRLANLVMQDINDSGALYSTVDSVALIAMLSTLKSHALFSVTPTIKINGQHVDMAHFDAVTTPIESIEIVDGAALVQIKQVLEHDWCDSTASMTVSTSLQKIHEKNNSVSSLGMGDRTTLIVTLEEGYVNGDLVHINLPASLSCLKGGGRVKQFSIDFAGKDAIEIPLLVTSTLDGPQHFAVLVRNMFEQDRVACPGLSKVS